MSILIATPTLAAQAEALARYRGWTVKHGTITDRSVGFDLEDGTYMELTPPGIADMLRNARAVVTEDEDAAVEMALLTRTRALQTIRDWARGPWPIDSAKLSAFCDEALGEASR